MAAILFKALVGLEAEEEDACTLFLRRQPNTRAHSSLLGRACPAVVLPARNDDNTVRKRARCLADDLLEDEY